MLIDRRQREIPTLEIVVVEQDAHVHAAVRGRDELRGQHPTGRVVLPDVVLQVEAALCGIGQADAKRERFAALTDDLEAGLIGVLRQHGREIAPDRRLIGPVEGRRRRAFDVWRQARAPGDERCDEQDTQAHTHKPTPPVNPGACRKPRRSARRSTRSACRR